MQTHVTFISHSNYVTKFASEIASFRRTFVIIFQRLTHSTARIRRNDNLLGEE